MPNSFLNHIKRNLRKHKPYIQAFMVKEAIANSLRKSKLPVVVSLAPKQASLGNVLFSYKQAVDAFSLKPGEPIPNSHTNYWASFQMAKTFLDLGYCVDVINHRDERFLPEKDYSIVVDVRRNLERIAPLLNKDCLKIMHLDTAHILFQNAAECRRLLELQQRRGVTLRPRRIEVPNLGIDYADCATTTGNAFTISTFKYANKLIYRLPVPAALTCPWPEGKDWEACRKRFLWFNSYGLVHKGLDLVLEAFADMPEYHLVVCGPIDEEEDFVRAYHKELRQTSNIQTIGWVDVNSSQFLDITKGCIGVILLSCSEGASASSVNCMHAGLIPILSHECGVDIDDFGFLLKDCSVQQVKKSIRMLASLPTLELKKRARQSWEFARANHTRQRFAEEYRKVVTTILSIHNKSANVAIA